MLAHANSGHRRRALEARNRGVTKAGLITLLCGFCCFIQVMPLSTALGGRPHSHTVPVPMRLGAHISYSCGTLQEWLAQTLCG